ncbi:hypothetical protein ACFVIM_33070 [Streptomyces sp. NPDC057638]|uniref:hypothetical protein n=1 Tax=Streptomyces sp. NPDC057638 TaxID=3346190 RepID=UPI0036BE623E
MTPLPPVSRSRRTVLSVLLCAGLALTGTACAEEKVDPDKGTNGVGKLSATEIETKARAAADTAATVRLSGTLTSKGGTYRLNMRLKKTGGTGSVATKDNTFALLRVGDDLYLKADAGFWTQKQEGGQAAPSRTDEEAALKLGDKYVKVPEDDASYQEFRAFTEMDGLLDGLLEMPGRLTKGERTKVGGVRAIKVASDEGAGGVLDVSLEGQPYPLQFARGGGAGTLTLGEWGADFPLAPPAEGEIVDYGRQLPKSSGG